jgi:hypothetical protein
MKGIAPVISFKLSQHTKGAREAEVPSPSRAGLGMRLSVRRSCGVSRCPTEAIQPSVTAATLQTHLDTLDVFTDLLAVSVRRFVQKELEDRILVVQLAERVGHDRLGEWVTAQPAQEEALALQFPVRLLCLAARLDEVSPVGDRAAISTHGCDMYAVMLLLMRMSGDTDEYATGVGWRTWQLERHTGGISGS